MRELWQFTKLIRSKNAGPFELTFDIMFKDRESYERVLRSRVLSAKTIAQLYGVPTEEVRLFEIEQINTLKFSIPRKVFSGDVADTDVYGGQFHGPLVRLPVEEDG
jgi:hypothetical protein